MRSAISNSALPHCRTRWPSARKAAPPCRRGWKRWWNRCPTRSSRSSSSRGDNVAFGHLEDRIVSLVEKLDASDSRLGHLEAIERGLADLLVNIEDIKADKGGGGLRASGAGGVDDLKHDIARTQDALEAVHGTLGIVVDRLATIEKDIRGEGRTRSQAEADFDAPAPPVGKLAVRMVERAGARAAAFAAGRAFANVARRRRCRRRNKRPRQHRRRPNVCRRPSTHPSIPICRPISRSSPAPGRRNSAPTRPRASPPRKQPSAAPCPPQPRPPAANPVSSPPPAAPPKRPGKSRRPRVPRVEPYHGRRRRQRLARQIDEAGQIAVHRGERDRRRDWSDPDRRQWLKPSHRTEAKKTPVAEVAKADKPAPETSRSTLSPRPRSALRPICRKR